MYARSEGNPLFTEELLAAGLDGRGELPPTLRDALMVRIEALPQDAQEVLRVISAGRSLDHALLAEASGLESGALREALREAAAGHVITADEEGNYAFRHALLREVVHDDLLPGEHTELHLALARAFEHRMQEQGGNARLAAGIAHHYLSAGDQPAAFAAAVRAADKAEEVHAHGEAATPVRARPAAVVARARPRGAGGHRPRDAAVPRPPTRTTTSPAPRRSTRRR